MAKVINPYNFVPFDKEPDRRQPEDNARINTGWMDVTVTPRTRLIIPDGAHPRIENEHKSYDFFRIGVDPVIPGSSIRGMIRSAFEAASNSCLPFLRDKEELTMRTPVCAAFKQRGLLHRNAGGQWELYDPVTTTVDGKAFQGTCVGRIAVNQLDQLEYGEWDGYENASVYKKGTPQEGTLQFHKPPAIPDGSSYHIRTLIPAGTPITTWAPGDDSPYESMMAALDATINNRQNRGRSQTHFALRKALRAAKNDATRYVPVWYLQVGSEFFLSPSAIGRVHQRTWEKIMGEYIPCSDLSRLCPACALFGTVEGGGLKGRVRFTDARYTGGKPVFDEITLDILAEPQPKAYEFYLRQPAKGKAIFWNYNYYSVALPGGGYEYKPLADKDFENGRLMPRGRKFYWHKPDSTARNNEKGRMNSTMEFLEPDGASFKFRVYFDGVTDAELSRLQWIINLGENNANGSLCHKLGHARPLGFGSVKLTIDSVTLRKLDWENGAIAAKVENSLVSAETTCPWDENSEQIKALCSIADLNKTAGIPVAYPMLRGGRDGTPKIYEWFAKNRTSSGVKQVLPKATAAVITIESDVDDSASRPAAGSSRNDTAVDVIEGTVVKTEGPKVTVKLCDMDAPGFFLNNSNVSNLRPGTKILVRLKSRQTNRHGNYDIEYVRHC